MNENELASRFPIFPLPNVVLFPFVFLPLHIFEPRYRQMIQDALAGDGLIGMSLLRHEAAEHDPPRVFETGCIGQISECNELPDGRFNLMLRGLTRFRIHHELETDRQYREVEAEILNDPNFDALNPATQDALQQRRSEIEQKVLELTRCTVPEGEAALADQLAALDPLFLVNAIGFGLDCAMTEKQSLLEVDDPVRRAELLVRLIEFRIVEVQQPGALGERSEFIN